jgi:transcriptional regulator with XRE-family HTH domain
MSRSATRLVSDNSPFARNLDAALHRAGETSESFARRIDRTLRTVQRWRSGESEPRGEDVVLIARALGVSVEKLYDRRTTPRAPEPEAA